MRRAPEGRLKRGWKLSESADRHRGSGRSALEESSSGLWSVAAARWLSRGGVKSAFDRLAFLEMTMIEKRAACIVALACTASAQQWRWVQEPTSGHWFGISYRGESWTSAEAGGVELGGHLATIGSVAEQDWIRQSLWPLAGNAGVWIGFHDLSAPGSFAWSSGEPVTYTNWAPGQPDNAQGNQHFAAIVDSTGVWDDLDNGATRRALVELEQPPHSYWTWPTSHAVPAAPHYLEISDVNADGLPDLVVPHRGPGMISILLNQGGGAFGSAQSFPAVPDSISVALADFDHDGDQDIAAVGCGSPTLALYWNSGAGSFVPGPTFAAAGAPIHVAALDIDNDGWMDLAVTTGYSGNQLHVFPNLTGIIGTATVLAAGSGPLYTTPADVNNDGWIDLVVSNAVSNTLGIHVNDGAGGFLPPAFVPAQLSEPSRAAAADFDLDGRLDLAVASGFAPLHPVPEISVFRGDGTGAFVLMTSLADVAASIWVDAADVDGDAKPDLVIGHRLDDRITVLRGDGMGRFGGPEQLTGPLDAGCIQLRDLDSDGLPEICVSGLTSPTVVTIGNRQIGGTIEGYCTAGTTTHGCAPALTGTGTPSATRFDGFTLNCSGVEGQRMGLVFYGLAPAAV
jgi:hypothetical protein